jgi:putative endonuclease
MKKQFYVYILTNAKHSVLYTGVTNDLRRRVYQHQHSSGHGFTSMYHATKLVFYEILFDPYNAIVREKQIKGGSR